MFMKILFDPILAIPWFDGPFGVSHYACMDFGYCGVQESELVCLFILLRVVHSNEQEKGLNCLMTTWQLNTNLTKD